MTGKSANMGYSNWPAEAIGVIHGLLLALLLAVLAVGKTLSSSEFEGYLQRLVGPAAGSLAPVVIGIEYILALGVGLSARVQRLRKPVLFAAVVLSVGLLATTIITPESPCGCFGAFGKASLQARLAVTFGLLYLSLSYVQAQYSPHTPLSPSRIRGARLGAWASAGVFVLALCAVFWPLGGLSRVTSPAPSITSIDRPIAAPDSPPTLLGTPTPRPAQPRPGGQEPDAGERVVSGRVTGNGQPIQGAFVVVAGALPGLVDAPGAARTDSEGRFSLHRSGDAVRLVAVANGWLPAEAPLGPAGESVNIELSPGRIIRGRVLDERDRAVAGADVWCCAIANTASWPRHPEAVSTDVSFSPGAHTVSASDGTWELAGLSDGRYEVFCSKPPGGFALARPPVAVAGDWNVDLRIHTAARARVEFVDDSTGGILPVSLIDIKPLVSVLRGFTIRRQWGSEVRSSPSNPVLEFVQPRSSANPQDQRGTLAIEVRSSYPGYADAREVVTLEWGEVRHFQIAMKPLNQGRAGGSLKVLAKYPNGRGYSGPLTIRIGTESGWVDFLRQFQEGLPNESIQVPIGRYVVVLSGWGSGSTMFWDVDATAREVDVGEETSMEMRVRGSRVALSVVSLDGNFSVLDYEVLVEGSRPGPADGWESVKGLVMIGEERVVMIPPGPARIRINHPLYGYGEATVAGSSNGEMEVLHVALQRHLAIDHRQVQEETLRGVGR